MTTYQEGTHDEHRTGEAYSKDDSVFIPLVTSDISPPKNPRSKARRLTLRNRPSAPVDLKESDSEIEMEARRRSNRSTRNRVDMRDGEQMDESSFYATEDKLLAAPKVMAISEIFQPVEPDSDFVSVHSDVCHACGGSRRKGQLVYCQGCSLTFHRNCLGPRSARDHMVTKIGDEDFVLQCRYCIGLYRKKDELAPRYDWCQDCKQPGKACAAFSIRKTSRQEEKIREENGGIDPITDVSDNLINNPDVVLFRCLNCHRGWHFEHLPPVGQGSDSGDIRSGRLEDYSIDWQCNDCASAKHKIHRLVAWRPAQEKGATAPSQQKPLSVTDFDEDSKAYLIKWESLSYFHCSWKPGAWVFGNAATAMRTAFAKRDAQTSMLSYDEKGAIPEEYLIPDIILALKMDTSAGVLRSKEDELANMSHVRQIFVKFQGLGYDDVVWDSPPKESMGKDIYGGYLEAFYDYMEGKYFTHVSQAKMNERVKAYKNSTFEELGGQPSGLRRGKLMGYQIEGLNWILENFHHGRSVVLADEMGLGKTVQVISLVATLVQDKPGVRTSDGPDHY